MDPKAIKAGFLAFLDDAEAYVDYDGIASATTLFDNMIFESGRLVVRVTIDFYQSDEAREFVATNPAKLATDHPDVWQWYVKTVYSERWKHAKVCMDGAPNQLLISRVLHEAICDAQDEGVSVKADAAVIMIGHQLAHLLDLAKIMDFALYSRVSEEVILKAAQYEAATKKPEKA